MLNFPVSQLMHRHDDGSLAPMAPHDPTSEDIEREWLRGGTIYRCSRCDAEIVVAAPSAPDEPEAR